MRTKAASIQVQAEWREVFLTSLISISPVFSVFHPLSFPLQSLSPFFKKKSPLFHFSLIQQVCMYRQYTWGKTDPHVGLLELITTAQWLSTWSLSQPKFNVCLFVIVVLGLWANVLPLCDSVSFTSFGHSLEGCVSGAALGPCSTLQRETSKRTRIWCDRCSEGPRASAIGR